MNKFVRPFQMETAMKQSGRNEGVVRGLYKEGTRTDLRASSESWGGGGSVPGEPRVDMH